MNTKDAALPRINRMLSIGDFAPELKAPFQQDPSGAAESGKMSLLVFAPPGWDPLLPQHIALYNKTFKEIAGIDARIVAIGERIHIEHESDSSDVALIADSCADSAARAAYGVGLHQTALFVVDERGIIRWSYAALAGGSAHMTELRESLRAITPGSAQTVALTRRQFVASAFAIAVALALPHRASAQGEGTYAGPMPTHVAQPGAMQVTLTVNGQKHVLEIDPRVTLLDALRERLGLTGSKKGCDHGQCGACTVHLDGRRVNACLTLAVAAQGKRITTIEGLAKGDALHPMQAAFIKHDGFQCGYCTPGQIMSAVALMNEPIGPGDSDVREAMSGNICRCGAYDGIIEAVQEARKAGDHVSI